MHILYVTTVSDTMRFFTEHIRMLVDRSHTVDLACCVTSPISPTLTKLGCKVYDLSLSRSPFSKANLRGYKQLRQVIREGHYDVIHTHTPVASALVRIACGKSNDVKVIYTAHGFHFYRGAPFSSWLLYYPVEKWLSSYTDVLITINEEDYERAKRKFSARRVEYVAGVGVDVKKLSGTDVDRKEKRSQLGLLESDFVLISTGELNANKNHQTVIHAVHKLNNPNVKYLICGQGPLRGALSRLIRKLGLEQQVFLLGYRTDVTQINHIADVFVFPSIREGLPVALMEAMVCGLPVVCSDIRGNRDLIEEGKGGFLTDPRIVDGFVDALRRLSASETLRREFGKNNLIRIEKYDVAVVLDRMADLYRGVYPKR